MVILKEEKLMKNLFAVLLCAAALMFVGCGSDDDSTTTTPEAGAAGEGGAAGEAEGGAAGEAEGGAAGEAEGGAAGEAEGGAAGEAEGGAAGEAEGGAAGEGGEEQASNIVEIAVVNGNFTILAQALETANLVETLSGAGPFTVFAPTDAAFEAALLALDISSDELLARPDLATILTYHVLGGAVESAALEPVQVVSTVAELSAVVTKDENGVKINGKATVTTPDLIASNGVIHVVDAVILPASILELAVAYPDFETLAAAAAAVPDVEAALATPGPFTVFAPTDAAFEAAITADNTTPEDLLARDDLGAILQYYALAGKILAADVTAGDLSTLQGDTVAITVSDDGVKVNEANVVITDIIGTNGVIHVIDDVLNPPEPADGSTDTP
jgi:transforming growth factor-beta-induced protein